MRSAKLVVALIVVLVFPDELAAQNTQFEFRGLHLSDTVTAQLTTDQNLTCVNGAERWSVICVKPNDQLAGAKVVTALGLVDRKISYIEFTFQSTEFRSLFNAFSIQWGKPISVKTEEVENRMGAKFENIVAVWAFSNATLQLDRYGSDLTEGWAWIRDLPLLTLATQRRDSAKAEAAKRDFAAPVKKP